MHAATCKYKRSLGAREQRGGFLDFGSIGTRAPCLRLECRLVNPEIARIEIVLSVRDILRHIDQHRAGAPARRNRKGASHVLGQPLDDLDANDLLHSRPQNFDLTRLLRHVLRGVLAVRIARDDDHGQAGVEALDDARYEVRRARTECAVAHTGPVRDLRVGVCCKGTRPLVVDERVLQAERTAGLIEGQKLETAHAEHRADP